MADCGIFDAAVLDSSAQTSRHNERPHRRSERRNSTIDWPVLRAVIDLEKLGPRTIWVDCDVLQADGGTRTTAITGASLALAIVCRKFVREKKLDSPPMQKLVAGVSAGILDGQAVVDLNYDEDKIVSVDFNLVATEDGEFVEVQSSGEEATFAGSQLDEMLALGRNGISALIGAQRAVLGTNHGNTAGKSIVGRMWPDIWRGHEWSRRAPSDIDGSPKVVSELARANQTPRIMPK